MFFNIINNLELFYLSSACKATASTSVGLANNSVHVVRTFFFTYVFLFSAGSPFLFSHGSVGFKKLSNEKLDMLQFGCG